MSAGSALVVGMGRMGGFHARILTTLGYAVHTVDPDPQRRAGHRTINARTLRGYRFDVACVAVPIPLLARTAAEIVVHHRPEYLLVEKPGASSLDDAARWWPVLERVNHVAFGYVERFNPVVQRLIHENRHRPDLECIEFTRLNDRPTANAALDLASHDVDLARYLAGHGIQARDTVYRNGGNRDRRERTVTLTRPTGRLVYDLTAHNGNPLEAQWEAFLNGSPAVATRADAGRVLKTLLAPAPATHAA